MTNVIGIEVARTASADGTNSLVAEFELCDGDKLRIKSRTKDEGAASIISSIFDICNEIKENGQAAVDIGGIRAALEA